MRHLNIGTHTIERQLLALPNIKGENHPSPWQQW